MTEIVWEGPPASARGGRHAKYEHLWIAEALRGRPGDWALILEDVPATIAHQIKRGILKAYRPAGSFEARTVSVDVSKGRAAKIYARYVGASGD